VCTTLFIENKMILNLIKIWEDSVFIHVRSKCKQLGIFGFILT
jgi:hypothetical protein